MLIAAGPDFKRGQIDDLPSGNIDLAPTILRVLGINPPSQIDGRILSEAMPPANSTNDDSKPGVSSQTAETKTIEATKHFPSGTWRQSLQISRTGTTVYLDEGNGVFLADKASADELQGNR
jgi:arylsulfatase A-like enzyme